MKKDLTDKVCLVTGGTQGIGLALVQAMAEQGVVVYACGRSLDNLRKAQDLIRSLPYAHRVHLSQCDITDRSALETWIMNAFQACGRIDILINNAAYTRWQHLADMTIEETELTLQTGFMAMVVGIKTVLPLMQQANGGWIVNMGSITGNIFVGGASAAYAAAKAAIDGFTQTLAIELHGTPVQVILVRLGAVGGTDFFKKHVDLERMPRLNDFIPMLTPPQVAQSVIRALHKKQTIVTLPGIHKLMHLIFVLFPGLSRWLARLGGTAQRNYAQAQW